MYLTCTCCIQADLLSERFKTGVVYAVAFKVFGKVFKEPFFFLLLAAFESLLVVLLKHTNALTNTGVYWLLLLPHRWCYIYLDVHIHTHAFIKCLGGVRLEYIHV